MESLKVRDHMNKRPVTFSPNMSLSEALDKLIKSEHTGGPVIDENRKLVGFISEQDMLHILLKVGYNCQDTHTVGDIMYREVLSVSPDDSIISMAEKMAPNKPKLYPVCENGRLVGIIARRNLLRAISAQIGECFAHPV